MKRAAVLVVLCFVVLAGAVFADGTQAPRAQEQAERFYVTGFVRTPGSYVWESGMSVNQAIARAGGFAERGSARGIKIIRQVDGRNVDVDATLSDVVQPNDTIRVRQRLQ